MACSVMEILCSSVIIIKILLFDSDLVGPITGVVFYANRLIVVDCLVL